MTKAFSILICANDYSPLKSTIDFLRERNYQVITDACYLDLVDTIKNNQANLILLELDLKNKDAISITSEIRSIKEIQQPYIIIFSNKNDDFIQITAFNSGADDFINTPIKPVLLEAKIATLKKRFQNQAKLHALVEEEPKFYVDKEQYLIITDKGKISLPRKEFEMVNLMYQNSNKIFTRQDFAKLIWNAPEVANTRTIDIHIRNIRRILGNDLIKTTKGVGYTINRDLI